VALSLWASMLLAGLILLRHNPYQPVANVALVVFMGGVLTLIGYWTGEPPRWRWGDRTE
jgi:hypothetical protein